MKEKIASEDRRSFSPELPRFEIPFVSVLFRKSHLLNFISLLLTKAKLMEARIKSCDSVRSLAQLVRANRIILFIVQRSYALFMKIRSDFATVPVPRGGGLIRRKCVTLPRICYALPDDAWCSITILNYRFWVLSFHD